MGNTPTKADNVSATGSSNNANEITIVQSIEEHKDSIQLLLIMIVVILVIYGIFKLYLAHRRCIQKQAINKSRDNLADV